MFDEDPLKIVKSSPENNFENAKIQKITSAIIGPIRIKYSFKEYPIGHPLLVPCVRYDEMLIVLVHQRLENAHFS